MRQYSGSVEDYYRVENERWVVIKFLIKCFKIAKKLAEIALALGVVIAVYLIPSVLYDDGLIGVDLTWLLILIGVSAYVVFWEWTKD